MRVDEGTGINLHEGTRRSIEIGSRKINDEWQWWSGPYLTDRRRRADDQCNCDNRPDAMLHHRVPPRLSSRLQFRRAAVSGRTIKDVKKD
jgi:hypothetical protein